MQITQYIRIRFYKQEVNQMGLSRQLSLIQDLETRYKSTYYMLQRSTYL